MRPLQIFSSRLLRRLIRLLVRTFLVLFFLLVLAFLLLQSGPGKKRLAAFVSDAVSRDGLQVTIEEVTGFIPFNIGVGRIVLMDEDGRWCTAQHVSVVWSPAGLLDGRLLIPSAVLGSIVLDRAPKQPEPKPKGPGGASLPLAVDVKRWAVDSIELGESVLGTGISAEASGNLHAGPDGVSADARSRYRFGSGPEMQEITVRLRHTPESSHLTATAELPELPLAGQTVTGAVLEVEGERIGALLDVTCSIRITDKSAVSIRAHGSPHAFDFTAEIAGFPGDQTELAAEGNLHRGEERVTLTIEQLQGRHEEFSLRLAEAATLHIGNETLTVDPTVIDAQPGLVRLAGQLAGEELDFTASCDSFPLGTHPWLGGAQVDGTLTADMHLTGTLAEPQLEVSVRLQEFTQGTVLRRAPPLDLSVEALLANDSLVVDATARCADAGHTEVTVTLPASLSLRPFAFSIDPGEIREAQLSGEILLLSPKIAGLFDNVFTTDPSVKTGRVRLNGALREGRLTGAAVCDSLPLDSIDRLQPAAIDGVLEAEAHLAGTPKEPIITVTARVGELRVKREGLHEVPPLQITAEGRLADGMLRVSAEVQGETAGRLHAEAGCPATLSFDPFETGFRASDVREAGLEGELVLDAINQLPLFPDQSIHGLVRLNLKYDGETGRFVSIGTNRLVDVRYEHMVLGTVIRDLEADIVVGEDGLGLENCTARIGDTGTLQAQGLVRLREPDDQSFKIDISFENATLLDMDFLTSTLSGAVCLSGSRTRGIVIDGRIRAERTELRVGRVVAAGPAPMDVVEVGGDLMDAALAPASREAAAVPVSGQVRLDIPGEFFVRGGGLDMVWRGGVDARHKPEGWAVVGELNAVRGAVSFVGRSFTLTEGKLIFLGQVPPSPTIAVQAEHQRAGLTARLMVTGRPDEPIFELSSNPPYPEDEILARILFGKGSGTITAAQAAQLALAARSLKGKGGGGPGVIGRAKEQLGIDHIAIQEGGDTEGDATLTAGRHLNSGAYLEVNRSLGRRGDGGVRLEYDLTPHISIETETGPRMRSGVGVNWRFDY